MEYLIRQTGKRSNKYSRHIRTPKCMALIQLDENSQLG